MKLGLSTFRRGPISGVTAVTVVTALVLVPVTDAYAAVTNLVNQAFTTSTVPNEWYLPPALSGTNDTCLTAATVIAQVPIPGCTPLIGDASGSGTLRLTTNTGSKVGSTFYQTSLPTSAGLDIKFDTYQYNASTAAGADGIGFALTAVDPTNPAPPAKTGPVGGSLGYSATGTSANGIPYGYLGYGADAWGNFANSSFGGSGCTLPANLATGKAYPENLTVRGPGNLTTGYCIVGTTASQYAQVGGAGNTGTISNLNGQYLDVKAATVRPAPVAAEIAMNPTGSPADTASGITVPANSYLIKVTPYTNPTTGTIGTAETLTGPLPTTLTTSTGYNSVLAGFPASWINPVTGVPYQVSFGWVASTGGSTEIHEVANLVATTLSGQLPVLQLGMSDNVNNKYLSSNHAHVTLTPAVSSSGGDEVDPLTITDTFPAGITPGTAVTSSWSCTTTAQTVKCTYAPSSPITAGTSLPSIDIPVTTGTTTGTLTNTARMGSIDGAPDATTQYYTVTTLGATATPSSVPYGTADTLGFTGLPANATGTVTYKTGTTTLCSVTLGTSTTCPTIATLAPATYPVTATYSGDGAYLAATASTSFTVTKASTAITATAAPASVPWGTLDTLTAGNVPAAATGTITFAAGGSTLCTATLPTLSCVTSSTLNAGTYTVTATYPGDGNFSGSTASASFVVVPTTTTFTASATPATVTYGTSTSLAESGLPAGATGTVTFTTGTTTLCVATLPTTSCNSLASQPAGTVNVTATYSGDTHWASSTAGTSYLVNKAATSMTATATPSSVPYETADTLAWAGLPGAATGSVAFTSGGSTLCTAVLPATSCQTATTLVTGPYSVTATYTGDGNFTGTTASTTLTVTKEASPFTVSASPTSVSYGNAVTLSESGLLAGATGTVTFVSGGTTLCTINRGSATSCTTTATLDAATYPVTATYSGDANHAGNTASTTFDVTKAASPFTAAASPTSTAFGNSVTLTETGLPAGAVGTVTWKAGGTTLCTETLPATSCGTSTSLAAGAYTVTATYSGDADHASSTAGTSFTITAASSAFTASATPSSVTYGNAVTLDISGLQGAATGAVTYVAGGATLCTATLPTTSCATTASLAVGSYSVTATYSGDGNINGSSATTSFTVTKIPSPVTASVTPASVQYQTATTLKESGLPAGATGSVTFASGGTTLCTVTLGSGNTCTTPTTLVVGSYTVTATYSGDATHLGSTDTTSFTVTKEDTSFTAAAAPSTTTYGNAVTLSDTGLLAGATGTITFVSGTTPLCIVNVATATSCSTSTSLDPGHYPVTATYSGDANHKPSSDTTSFDVTKAPAPVVATATPSSVAYGTAVTLSGTGLPAAATGTLTFVSGSTTLCTVNLSSGYSCLTPSTLDPATFPVTVTYSGDTDFASSTDTTTFTVTAQTTGVVVSASPAVVAYGTAVTLSETALPAAATGTVTFTSGSTTLCTVTVGSSTSCATPSTLEPGTYPVTGTYSGDADYAPSSDTTTFDVNKAPAVVVATATPGTVSYGNAVVLKETGLPAGATGSVVFTAGGNTLCTVALGGPNTCSTSSALPAGDYVVTATYSGDAHFSGSVDSVTFHVTPAVTALTASATPGSVVFGTSVTLAAGGLPGGASGQVSFSTNGTALCSVTLPTVACATPASLATGTYPVDAAYSGDANYAASSATTSFHVTPAATAVSVGASPSTTPYGNPVTLTTTGLPTGATGWVVFTSGSQTLCTVDITVASTCTTPATLNPGSWAVTGTYSGDANYAGSVDHTAFSISKLPTSLTAAATPASVSYGTAVTLSEGGLPADALGTVTFAHNGTTLCTLDLSTDTSCVTSATLTVGSYVVSATYSGDVAHNGSSATTSFVVGTAPTTLHASAAPTTVAYGSGVTLSEAGLPAGATGTVTFTDGGGTFLCSVDVTTASSCATSSALVPGSYAVTATYSGDVHYAGSSDSTGFSVTTAPSGVVGSGPAHSTYGTPITLTVGGLPAGATGTVVLSHGGTTLCTVTLPATSCTVVSTLPVGTYTVDVSYPGDADYAPSSDTFSIAVDKAATTVSGSSTPASVAFGDPVTLTPGGLPADATGTVTFSSGGMTLCTVVIGVSTSCQTPTTLTAATYPVTVDYSGDSNYHSSSSSASFTIGAASTVFAVTATPSTTFFGTAVTLTPAGLPSGATGTVTMTAGTTTLCSVLLGSQTSCQPSAFTPVGTYAVDANYSGDTNFAASTAHTSFDVVAAPAPFTAAATPTPATYGTAVTLSESGLPALATGMLTFHQGPVIYCTATLPATSCLTGANLDPGTYPIAVDYSGDASYQPSSAGTSFTVVKAPVTLTATATPGSTAYSNAVTLTAAGLPPLASGSVTFVSGATTLCTVTLPATSCSSPATLASAVYPVTATYSGDVDYLGAQDHTAFTIVRGATAVAAAATPASVSYGSPVTLTDANLPASATGTVTFVSGSATLCTVDVATASSCTTSSSLAAGSYPVTATYSGDVNWSSSVDHTAFSVGTASVSLSAVAVPATVSYGHPVTLVPSGLPASATGNVVFSTGVSTLCTVALASQASCVTSSTLPPGVYPVDAVYPGDSNHAGAAATTTFTVTKAAVAITASASPTGAQYGQQVTLSAAGLPAGATGTVAYSSGGTVLCTATLPAASCGAAADLAPGSYPVDVAYSGDANHSAATATTSFSVVQAPAGFTAATDPAAVPHGTPTSLSFSGLPAGATGTVTFSSGGVVLCTVTLGSPASCPTPASLATGDYPVVATYSGDAHFLPATASTGFTVGPVAGSLVTTGPVNKPQQAKATLVGSGSITLLDAHGRPALKVVEPGQGTYVLNPKTGVITFTPLPTFAGDATAVRYRITDAQGQSDTGTYRAHVVPPKGPKPADRATTGPVDSPQHTTVVVPHGDTVTLLDAHGHKVTHVEIAGRGSYSLDPTTGVITFQPASSWIGAAGAVTFAVTDAFGQRGTAVYGATVTGTVVPPTPQGGAPQPPPLPSPEPGTLPFTGFNAERLLLMTGFMVSTGIVMVVASRRSVTGRLFGTRG